MIINGQYDGYYDAFARGFEIANRLPDGTFRDGKLVQLMTEMERHYAIPMNKERFEREIAEPIRELYLAVSSARKLEE